MRSTLDDDNATNAPRLVSALGPVVLIVVTSLSCLPQIIISCIVEPIVVALFKDLGSHKLILPEVSEVFA